MQPQPQPQPQQEKPETQSAEARAEQLLALRAPLIERGKKVPALKRSIAAHEVEANALYALLRTANTAEKILSQQYDEACREVEIARLETDLVRERLRTAEAQLADARDHAHVKDVAHMEEVNVLRKRCSAMKRKIDFLATTQKRELENKITQLENTSEDLRKEVLEITNERDEWRESTISTERQLKQMKAKYTKLQAVSALLQTERTLSASLQKQLKDAQHAVKAAEEKNAKLSTRDSEMKKVQSTVNAEKEKTAELRRKLKDADASTKKMKREETKLRQKCDDLETSLKEALARAVKAEERAADMEKRPATRSRAAASPGQGGLMSPAPLAFGKRPAEDMASESRSRFTCTLPQGIQDEGDSHDDESEEPSPRPRNRSNPASRSKRKKAKPKKLGPPRKTIAKRASRRPRTESESLRGLDTKKGRQPASAKESNGPTSQRGSATASPGPVNDASPKIVTPRRKHGKATRKTTGSTPPKRPREPPREAPGLNEVPRRTLRSRRAISYNYDEQDRDLVQTQPGYEVDYEALKPLKLTRTTRSQTANVAAQLDIGEQTMSSRTVSPSTAKRPRRMETVRKQVPNARGGIK